jgi:hypothetical protein
VSDFSPAGVIAEAVAACQQAQPSFDQAAIRAQITAKLPPYLGLDDGGLKRLVADLTDVALASDLVVQVTAPAVAVPAELQLADGSSGYHAPGAVRYAATGHVAAERALQRAAVARGRYAVAGADADRWLTTAAPAASLGADQAAAVRGLLTSGAEMSVLVGPAGTGKSYTVGALSQAWSELTGGRLIGVATSEVATRVLINDGVTALNTTRWLDAMDAGRPEWALTGRDILVVDEASMVDTAALERIRGHVARAGARLILTGDPRQLPAVGAGGAMAMLADGVAETHHLAEPRRFTQAWERTASLALRDGDPAALAEYDRRGRVHDAGTAEQAGLAAARAYVGDTLAGKTSLVIAATNREAAASAGAVRQHLVTLGRVGDAAAILGLDGNSVGVGDLIHPRRNDWNLGVINRDLYRVDEIRPDGSMVVRGTDGSVRVLPASYVDADVTLAYASTVHAGQGLTVDTCHAVPSAAMSPEALYVAMSRGRESNTAHVATHPSVPDENTGETHERDRRAPLAVLSDIMDRDQADAKAVLVQAADDVRREGSAHTSLARREDAVREVCRRRTAVWLDQITAEGLLSPEQRVALAADAGAEQLSRLLRVVEQAGHDPQASLRTAITASSLDDARSLDRVLYTRVAAQHRGDLAPRTDGTTLPVDTPQTWRPYLETLTELADERRRKLGEQTAEQAPQWAVEALGPVPTDAADRAEWTRRAGITAAHREATKWTDDTVAIGPSPAWHRPNGARRGTTPGRLPAGLTPAAKNLTCPKAHFATGSRRGPGSRNGHHPASTPTCAPPASRWHATSKTLRSWPRKPTPAPTRLKRPGCARTPPTTRPWPGSRPRYWPTLTTSPSNAPNGWSKPPTPANAPNAPKPSWPTADATSALNPTGPPPRIGSPPTRRRCAPKTRTARSPKPTW